MPAIVCVLIDDGSTQMLVADRSSIVVPGAREDIGEDGNISHLAELRVGHFERVFIDFLIGPSEEVLPLDDRAVSLVEERAGRDIG
jgi:hypothetical protein